METGTRHDDVAAYVLGVLDPEDAEAFARHLNLCGQCQREMDEFGLFAPKIREAAAQGAFAVTVEARAPVCRFTRSLLLVAAGFVVAIAAVLSVVESLSGHTEAPPGGVASVGQVSGGQQPVSSLIHPV